MVDLILGRAGDIGSVGHLKQAVSLSLKPRCSARSLTAMLWAFDPVKYCAAAPALSVATTRKSTCIPPRSKTLDFVGP